MQIPENPPDFIQIFKDKPDVVKELFKPEVRSVVDKSIREYPYWSKFKYWQMPEGLTPEIAWVLREFLAIGERKYIPLMDTQSQPFSYWLPDSAQETLHNIDRQNPGEKSFSGEMPSPQERDRYIVNSLMEEAIASSQIEGAATTRRVAKEMLRTGRPPADKSEKMILNNYRAMERLRELKKAPLTLEVLNELHVILTENTLDDEAASGRLRQSPHDDDVCVYDDEKNIIHRPPKGDELPARLDVFLKFANDEDSRHFIHPVIKAILLHFWIGYIHPYVDGNGRTARAVFYWYLLRKGYWLFEFVSLSRMVLRAWKQYARAFVYSERAGNDATYFIMFNLQAIQLAVEEVHRYINKKRTEISQAAALLRGVDAFNRRQREVLLDAFRKPGRIYSIYNHQKIHNISYQSARMDLLDLVAKKLFIVIKSGKTHEFMAVKNLRELIDEKNQ